MAVRYGPARDVEKIAQQLIDDCHADLEGVPIEYHFQDVATKKAGIPQRVKVQKIGGLTAYLSRAKRPEVGDVAPDPYFLVVVARDEWEKLEDDQRVALVDHALCRMHAGWDDEGEVKLALIEPDVVEFHGVIQRRGAWTPDLERFAVAASQLKLDLSGDGDGSDDDGEAAEG